MNLLRLLMNLLRLWLNFRLLLLNLLWLLILKVTWIMKLYFGYKDNKTGASMIHSARPIVTPVANIVFCCFVFLDFKSGDGGKDNMCENNDPYRP